MSTKTQMVAAVEPSQPVRLGTTMDFTLLVLTFLVMMAALMVRMGVGKAD
jgi:hypothetical protein